MITFTGPRFILGVLCNPTKAAPHELVHVSFLSVKGRGVPRSCERSSTSLEVIWAYFKIGGRNAEWT